MGWKNKCFRDKTKLEKLLIVFVIILFCIVLVMFTTILSTTYGNGVCTNPECIKASTHILNYVDPTVDPCDNFYNFACGTFMKNAFATNQVHEMKHLSELMQNQLKEIVVGPTNISEKLPHSVEQQRKFYKACINTTALDKDDNQTFLKHLDKLGGWPVAKGTWEESQFLWVKSMTIAKHLGFPFDFFLRIGVHQFENNTEPVAIKVTSPFFSIAKSDFDWNEDTIPVIEEIATILGTPSAEATTELRRTMHFAEELKNIAKKAWDESHYSTNKVEKTPIKNLDTRFIKIPWLQLLQNITDDQRLTQEDQVVFHVENYLKDLYFLLLKTPKRIQANYMGWYIISKNIIYLSTKIRDAYAQKKYLKTNKTNTREDICYEKSTNLFPHVAKAEYVRKYVGRDKQAYIKKIIDNLKEEMELLIKSNTWMDVETKLVAQERLKNMKEIIGAEDLIYDVENFDKHIGFAELNFTSSNLIDMTMVLSKNGKKQLFKLVSKNIDKLWFTYPFVAVNSYIYAEINHLVISGPILQGIIFNTQRPLYMNYGSLGSILGFDLTHGFTYSKECKLKHLGNWFSNKSIRNFEDTTKCFLDHHENFGNPGDVNLNNSSCILEESLADFTGRKISYGAYQNWVQEHGHEEKLPGVSYTPNQIFWIMSSTYLCTEPHFLEFEKKMKSTRHADKTFRVNGALRNSPYFVKDFNCPAGSRMNPERKCRLF